jgi:hypothetical protein
VITTTQSTTHHSGVPAARTLVAPTRHATISAPRRIVFSSSGIIIVASLITSVLWSSLSEAPKSGRKRAFYVRQNEARQRATPTIVGHRPQGRQAGILADSYLPVLAEPAQIAMCVALCEGLAVLDDGLSIFSDRSRAITLADGGVDP